MSVYITRTNQKLYFARLHLDQLKAAEASSGWSKHALIESYNESVLFHLTSAYQSFLCEIAEVYRVAPEKIDGMASLVELLDAQGLEAPEVKELQQLRESDSWLAMLLAAYKACWIAEDRQRAEQGGHQSLSEIHVVQVNPDHAEDKEVIAQLDEWLDAFRNLIDRQRESMKEW